MGQLTSIPSSSWSFTSSGWILRRFVWRVLGGEARLVSGIQVTQYGSKRPELRLILFPRLLALSTWVQDLLHFMQLLGSTLFIFEADGFGWVQAVEQIYRPLSAYSSFNC